MNYYQGDLIMKDPKEKFKKFFYQDLKEFLKSTSNENQLPPKYRNMFLTIWKKEENEIKN